MRAVVVIPARNEEQRIGDCLRALAAQVCEPGWEVIVVLDRCTDATRERALAASAGLLLEVVESPEPGVGAARRFGMDRACERLPADGLIASTDADTIVAPDWLQSQMVLLAAGARAIGGDISLDAAEADALAQSVLTERAQRADERLRLAGGGEHHHFAGASLGIAAGTYAEVGGLPPHEALEDEAMARRLEEYGVPIVRSSAVRVRTSARIEGRAPRGLARDLALSQWRATNTLSGARFDARELARTRSDSISLVLPAREVADTIGDVVAAAARLRALGLIDEILVIDANSLDGTPSVARAAGARVLQESAVLAECGRCLGKGDAMWRGLAASTGEIVVFLDTDTEEFDERFIVGLLGPLVEGDAQLVKGSFERPLRVGEQSFAGEGGRVTELLARPLLNLYWPQLAGFDQPLAGEIAARRTLLESLAFPVGYGIEIAMLIDAAAACGLESIAQVELGSRQNRHQSLRELSAMAYAVLVAATRRLPLGAPSPGVLAMPSCAGGEVMEMRSVPVLERPALAALRALSPAAL